MCRSVVLLGGFDVKLLLHSICRGTAHNNDTHHHAGVKCFHRFGLFLSTGFEYSFEYGLRALQPLPILTT